MSVENHFLYYLQYVCIPNVQCWRKYLM
jgi:hypothetical protein